MAEVGVVVIGRNEGERLRRCLESVLAWGVPAVYVDSGSTDGSVGLARGMGLEVVELDPATPFSAGRGRNEGFSLLTAKYPEIRFVQFVDGDCVLEPEWRGRAVEALEQNPKMASVCGRLRELHPEASIYNRLCEIAWNGRFGEVAYSGGIFMARCEAFGAVGGFEPGLKAGEEPELCLRLRQRGWTIVRLDAEMARHDAAMLHWSQWWRRQYRSGYGALNLARLLSARGEFPYAREIRSARLWTLGWLGASGVMMVAGAMGHWAPILLAGIVAAAALPLQMARLAARQHRAGADWPLACAYGILTMLGKWPQLLGQISFWRDSIARRTRTIEYKGPRVASAENAEKSVAHS